MCLGVPLSFFEDRGRCTQKPKDALGMQTKTQASGGKNVARRMIRFCLAVLLTDRYHYQYHYQYDYQYRYQYHYKYHYKYRGVRKKSPPYMS